jgi:PTH1 family peptidyl-tRNA hydrolase
MNLIVGLGNPGSEYATTRHNVGFMVVDRLARRHGLIGSRRQFNALTADGRIIDRRVVLMQPQTYMNRSGDSVGEAARFYKLDPIDLMIIVDDTALPIGALRLRPGGSPGGHNGLADIERVLGSGDYPRLRVGIGEPRIGEHRLPQKDYVLSDFTDEQKKELERALDRACDAVETWLRDGIDQAMTQYNRRSEPSLDDTPPSET